MGTRERDQQAEQERQQQEQAQQEQRQRPGAQRDFQAEGDDESSTNPVIINR